MDVEAEIVDLRRRVTALENEDKANHDVSVKLFSHLRDMREDLALVRSHAVVTDKRLERLDNRMDRVEQRLDRVEQRLDRVEGELTALRSDFNAFRKELPGMIADTMREVLRDYRSR